MKLFLLIDDKVKPFQSIDLKWNFSTWYVESETLSAPERVIVSFCGFLNRIKFASFWQVIVLFFLIMAEIVLINFPFSKTTLQADSSCHAASQTHLRVKYTAHLTQVKKMLKRGFSGSIILHNNMHCWFFVFINGTAVGVAHVSESSLKRPWTRNSPVCLWRFCHVPCVITLMTAWV